MHLELDHMGYWRQSLMVFHGQKQPVMTISCYSMGHRKKFASSGGGFSLQISGKYVCN